MIRAMEEEGIPIDHIGGTSPLLMPYNLLIRSNRYIYWCIGEPVRLL